MISAGDSLDRRNWLAMSISDESCQSKSADRESEKINEKLRLLSLNWLRRNKLIKLVN